MFEIGGFEYRAGKIDARKQFHIVRRLAPIFGGMAAGAEPEKVLADAIGALSDDDADYVLFGLLEAVTRKQENGLGFAKVSTGKQLMFADITMAQMLQLAFKSFEENMQDFFTASRSVLQSADQKQSDQ